ncbi:MAG TPA: GDCCVxC domain-containing (seleno)protein [Caulobacteraceae bacterium]|nr:GDCCVxC domain-containing (seleno)protein [Caulobacteraceae bacterium]
MSRPAEDPPRLTSELTCPCCGHRHAEIMPTDACIYFFECRGCGARLKPKTGDCCVFCSYGSIPCPPKQCAPSDQCGDPGEPCATPSESA